MVIQVLTCPIYPAVTPAADGFQALKMLSDKMKQFDLVLTEVVMPGLSGIQLLSRIQQRDQHKRMPVISEYSKLPLKPHQVGVPPSLLLLWRFASS